MVRMSTRKFKIDFTNNKKLKKLNFRMQSSLYNQYIYITSHLLKVATLVTASAVTRRSINESQKFK